MKKTEMYVYLGISGFKCQPDLIAQFVGVKPTNTFKKGDPIPGTKVVSKLSGWEYRIDASSSLNVDLIVRKILRKFKNIRALKKAISMGSGSITCVLYARDRSAEIWLSPSTIKRISQLNCEFHVDYYILSGK